MSTATSTSMKTIPKYKTRFYVPIKKIVLQMGEAFERDGDVLQLTGFPATIYCFRHPDQVGEILKHPKAGDTKFVKMLPRVKSTMGSGGYILEGGPQWHERRVQVQAAFRRQSLVEYTNKIPAITEQMLEGWSKWADDGSSFDLCEEFAELITRANFQMFFSSDIRGEQLHKVVEQTHFINLNFVRVSPLWLPLPGNLKFRHDVQELRQTMLDLVAKRRANPQGQNDLLTTLLELTDAQTGRPWSDEEIVGEIFSVYFGASVMSTSLAWCLYLVTTHPEVQEKLISEADSVLGGNLPTADDVPQLEYAQMVLNETFRLYPPSWGYPRFAVDETEIGGYAIPAKSMLIPMVWHTHRDPRFWDSPESFDPERFSAENKSKIQPYSHLPFGVGSRICLGTHLAPMVLSVILAMIHQRYRLTFHPQFAEDPVADFGFEIHPKHAVHMSASRIR